MARNETTDMLVRWLNDAYAMEEALEPILEDHAEDATGFPEIEGRIRRHLEETRHQKELVKGCLERLGESPSTAKSVLGKMVGAIQAPATGMFEDEMVKNGIADYATEHFEIASYNALIHAARSLGEEEIASTCEQIRDEEQRMADWLEETLPRTVQQILQEA